MKLIIGLACLAIVISQQIPPIPSSPDGIAYGPSVSTNYTLDVFWDHLCPYSANAFPGLYLYWSNNQHWLRMVIHILPLPYHYYAFDVGRAGRFIQQNYAFNFTSFLSYIFQHQSKYTDAAQYWDQTQLYYYLSLDTQAATGVDPSLVTNALNDPTYSYSLRLSGKYAAVNGINGTPLYKLNGVLVPQATELVSFYDWQNFFNSLNS